MKMTIHIDDGLLKRVMDAYDLETKTDAIHFALVELERRHAMKKTFAGKGLGLPLDEYADAIDPASYRELPWYAAPSKVAEDAVEYGKPRPR